MPLRNAEEKENTAGVNIERWTPRAHMNIRIRCTWQVNRTYSETVLYPALPRDIFTPDTCKPQQTLQREGTVPLFFEGHALSGRTTAKTRRSVDFFSVRLFSRLQDSSSKIIIKIFRLHYLVFLQEIVGSNLVRPNLKQEADAQITPATLHDTQANSMNTHSRNLFEISCYQDCCWGVVSTTMAK